MKWLVKFVYKICMEYCMFVIGIGCVFGVITLYGMTSVPVQSLITFPQNITFGEYWKMMEIILTCYATLYILLKVGYIVSKMSFPDNILPCLYPFIFTVLFTSLHLWRQLFSISICVLILMFVCKMIIYLKIKE
jgi:hypothetical protein